MRKNKIIVFVSSLLLCLIVLCGCNNENSNNEDKKEKIIQELSYLDTELVEILNKLNNISLDNFSIKSDETALEGSSSAQQSRSRWKRE